MQDEQPIRPKRRIRYGGKNPRKFEEKYKELDPERYGDAVSKIVSSGKTPAGTHRPVCVKEILEILVPKPGDVCVDVTLGYGGHASAIIPKILPGGIYLGLDVDPVELPKTKARLEKLFPAESLRIIRTNHAALSRVLAEAQIPGVHLILADLGVSSMQIDNPARGFTYKADGPLDLRMNPSRGETAAAWIARVGLQELVVVLVENADEPNAETIARAIVNTRRKSPVQTTRQLADLIRTALLPVRAGQDQINDSIRRTFQALRIAVNDEFSTLENFLGQLPQVMLPRARAAILTFHSGEDRRVKKAFKTGLEQGCYRAINDEVIRPSAKEVFENPRASSAKLRWAVRA